MVSARDGVPGRPAFRDLLALPFVQVLMFSGLEMKEVLLALAMFAVVGLLGAYITGSKAFVYCGVILAWGTFFVVRGKN